GSPFLTLVVLMAAAAGVGAIYLGVHEGSFSRGGQVVDQKLAGVAQPATPPTAPATRCRTPASGSSRLAGTTAPATQAADRRLRVSACPRPAQTRRARRSAVLDPRALGCQPGPSPRLTTFRAALVWFALPAVAARHASFS